MDRELEELRRQYFAQPDNIMVIQQLDALENRIHGESITLRTLNLFVTPNKNKDDVDHVSHTLWAKIVPPLPILPELAKKWKRKAIYKGKKGYKIASIESYSNYAPDYGWNHNWGRFDRDGIYDDGKSHNDIKDAIIDAINTDKVISELKEKYIVNVYLPELKPPSERYNEWFVKKTKWSAEDFKTQWRLFRGD